MDFMLKQFDISQLDQIKIFYADVFTNEPWNDDWSDEKQLQLYLQEQIGNANSLSFGYYLEDEMVGLCIGHIVHWCTGTQYTIEEFCVSRHKQGLGIGTRFLADVERYVVKQGIKEIFLQTDRSVPAFDFYKKNGMFELTEHVSFVKKIV